MRNINELIGIINAVSFDNVINQREIDFLRNWVESNRNLAYEPKAASLIKLVEDVIDDNVVTDEERKQLFIACYKLQRDNCKASDKIYELHGIIDGIISDGEVNEPEVRKLKNWLVVNKKYLSGYKEAEVLDKKLDEILEDNIVTIEEQEELLNMLSETIEERKLETKLDFLRQKVRCRENIGMDLIDMLNNEKHINHVHTLAEKRLREALNVQSGRSSDEAVVFISLVLIAMLYYDGNFYDNVAKVYPEIYKQYPKQKIDGRIRGIIDRFCTDEQRASNTRTYVGNILANSIVPSNYLKSFFEFIYDIYKTNLHYTLQKNPYDDFRFVYDGLRKKLRNQALGDELTLKTQDAPHKTYKLIKSTKDLILDSEKVDDVIKLSILVAKLIDKHIWSHEVKIVNPYLKNGFNLWVKTVTDHVGSGMTRDEFHSRWEPKLVLKGNDVELVPPVHRIPGDYDGQPVTIEIANGREILFVDNKPEIFYIIGGYEIRPKSVKINKPLGKLTYRLKIDGYEKYKTGSKLHRDCIVFSADGKEIKNNTDYDGTVVICNNIEILKAKAYVIDDHYNLISRTVHCGDVINVGDKLFSFSALAKPGISGDSYYRHYIVEVGKSKKLAVYKSIKYLVFECEKNSSSFAIIINGKRKRLADFEYRRIDLTGKYRYIVHLNITEAGIYNFEVEQLQPSVIKIIKGIQAVVDPILDFTNEQLSDTTYAVTVKSAFLSQDIYQNIEAFNFNLDWLKVTVEDKNYIYYLPFDFRFFRIKGKEWRSNRDSLWINELTADSVLEFYGNADSTFVLTDTGEIMEPMSLLQKDSPTIDVPVGYLKSFKEQYSYVVLVLMKDGKQHRGVYCNNKCNLDIGATEINFDAATKTLYVSPLYYGDSKVVCKIFDEYSNLVFESEVQSRASVSVRNIKAYTKYNICFFEKMKGIVVKGKKERLMNAFTKEFYSLDSFVGRQFKLINAYYEQKSPTETVEGTMKLQNTYVAIKSKYSVNKYIAEIFTSDANIRRELKSLNPVLVELCSNVIGDVVEVSILRRMNGTGVFIDDERIVEGSRRGAKRIANTFDMRLSSSSKFIRLGK